MLPEELRFITSLAESGDDFSEKQVRIAMSLSVHQMPMEFLVEMCEQWADYMELCAKVELETR